MKSTLFFRNAGATGVLMAVVVTLEMFSGRPGPHWDLTAGQSAELEARLAAVPLLASGGTGRDEPLGYRGFSVTGGTAAVQVFGGQIMVGGQTFADKGRVLERWLLDTGRRAIDPTAASYVDSQIAATP